MKCYNLECNNLAKQEFTAFCSLECKHKYNNTSDDARTKTSFKGMTGDDIRQFALNRFKDYGEKRKQLELELEKEWQEEKEKIKSDENYFKEVDKIFEL